MDDNFKFVNLSIDDGQGNKVNIDLEKEIIDRLAALKNKKLIYRNYKLKEETQRLRGYYKEIKEKNGEFMFIFQKWFGEMAKNPLKPNERRLLDWIIYKVHFGEEGMFVKYSPTKIGKELNIFKGDVSKAIKTLEKRGFVEKLKSGSTAYLQVSKDIGFKGSFKGTR